MPTRNDILRIAGAEVGYTERGNNNTKYWTALKPNWQGQPWCAAFTAWVYQRAGLDVLLKGPSLPFYTPSIEAWAKANKRWVSVRDALPGDLVLYGNSRAVHIGVLVSQGGGFVRTIEGNTSSGVFGSQAGAADSYVGANYLSTGSGAIDNWLISPLLAIDAGSVLSFYTRSAGTAGFADELGVYYSVTGGTAVSDFVLLGSIGGGHYPIDWTKYSFDLSASAAGRFAFRQGGTYDTADYLGVDTVSVAAATNPVPEPSTYALMALGIAAVAVVRRRRCPV